MNYTAKIEQTKDYKKRMHYMPNTDTFEEKDCDSLSYIRNVHFPSGDKGVGHTALFAS